MPDKIKISEIYGPVLQGEGPSAGTACIFVRTFGCDSLCRMCDSLYAVVPTRPDATFELLGPTEIIERINAIDTHLPIVFSGGNPVVWNLEDLVGSLKTTGRTVWVETQGTYWRDWVTACDQVIVSPKGPFMDDRKLGLTSFNALDQFDLSLLPEQLYFKVVVGRSEDFDYAEKIAARYWRPIYLSLGCPRDEGVPHTKSLLMMRDDLLTRYQQLTDMLLDHNNASRWPNLRHRAKFIPQLHILTYGDARSV